MNQLLNNGGKSTTKRAELSGLTAAPVQGYETFDCTDLVDEGPTLIRHAIRQCRFEIIGVEMEAAAVQPLADSVETAREAGQFFSRVLALATAGQRVAALDLLHDTLDTWLLDGALETVRWVLMWSIPHVESPLPLSIFLGLLSATRPWRGIFGDERERLVKAVQMRVEREVEPQHRGVVLAGLT